MHNALAAKFIANAQFLGHQTQIAAAAVALLGIPAQSLCCWCSEHVEGQAHRLRAGGECDRCAYVGRDCLVIVGETK
jgi:hypothetical protein